MRKIKLGNSTLNVTVSGYGCMGLSEFYGPTSEIQAEKILTKVIESGINFLDTADIYGYGQNEKLLSRVLKHYSDSDIVVATKCGIVRNIDDPLYREVNNKYHYIMECCEKSSERLGRKIDLYYLHRVITSPDSLTEALTALHELRQKGYIETIGLSEVTTDTILFAHQNLLKMSDGKQGLNAVQVEYSLLTRDIEKNGVLDLCRQLGISVVSYSPISRGLLSGKLQTLEELSENDSRRYLPRFMDYNLQVNNRIVAELGKLADSIDITPAQLSLAWIINHHTGIIPIPGTRTESYLQENNRATDIILPERIVSAIEKIFTEYKTAGTRYPEAFLKAYGMQK